MSALFELEKSSVHAIVAKMIITEELMASLDEPTGCMVMHKTEPSRLQSLSLQLSDKIAQLVDNNERLLDFRPGENKILFLPVFIFDFFLTLLICFGLS